MAIQFCIGRYTWNRDESGSHLLTFDPLIPQNNLDVTHIWPTCDLATYWSFLFKSCSMSGLKVGQMTWTIWVTWVAFLVGQVGLICKLNYLDVTWPDITCSLGNSVGIWYVSELWFLWMHWNIIGSETSLLSQAGLKHVVFKDFTFK